MRRRGIVFSFLFSTITLIVARFSKNFIVASKKILSNFILKILKIIKFSSYINDWKFDVEFKKLKFLKSFDIHVCIDIDYDVILKNRTFVKSICLKFKICFMTTLLQIKKIESITYETNEWIKVSMNFLNIKKDE